MGYTPLSTPVSFLSALLFWWSLLYARGRAAYGLGVLYIFTTAVHTSILGAADVCAGCLVSGVWLRARVPGESVLSEDRNMGGLIMWVPAGVVYVAAGLALFAGWLRGGRLGTRKHAMRVKWRAACVLMIAPVFLGGCSRAHESSFPGGDPVRGAAAIPAVWLRILPLYRRNLRRSRTSRTAALGHRQASLYRRDAGKYAPELEEQWVQRRT